MRSVVCYLTDCTKAEVAGELDARFVAQAEAPWLIEAAGGDVVAYIDFHDAFATELDADLTGAIVKALGERSRCVSSRT